MRRIGSTNFKSFCLGTAAFTVMGACSAALAQPAPTPEQLETVVVTGSHIRGVAPVGSPAIAVDTTQMQERGVDSLSTLLNDLPQVSDIGFNSGGLTSGRNVQGGGGNQTYANSVNLRGLGPQDTLNLINSMRLVAEQTGTVHDIDVVPSMMVRRIDVVADGGSAIYGTDAVTGTANVILKTPAQGTDIMVSAGNDPGQWSYQGGIMVGQTWQAPGLGEGGVLVAVQYYHTDQLFESHRPAIFFTDLTPYLGAAAPAQSTFSSPGNVVIGANTYAIPSGIGGTQAITLAQLGPANQPNYVNQKLLSTLNYADPYLSRWNAGINARQDITDWLNVFFTAYGQMKHARAAAGASNQTFSVPNTNPYSPCAPSAVKTNAQGIVCPANGTISVRTTLLPDIGPGGSTSRLGLDHQFSLQAGANVTLPFGWKATLATEYAGDFSNGHDPGTNSTAVAQVLSGVGKPSNVPFLNPFCDGHQIGPGCNDPLTAAYIGGFTDQTYTNTLSETVLNLDGPLFDLPGGTVRLAVGGEYDNERLFSNSDSTTSPAIGVRIFNPQHANRNVSSHYEELYIPLIGPGNAMGWAQELEIDLANRYTYYAGTGVTDNPKAGINFTPVEGLKLRGSWGTSFRAPSLRDSSTGIATSLFIANGAQASTFIGAVASPTTLLSDIEATGGNPAIRPETAVTWSVGADWAPEMIEGLDLDLNYFNISSRSVIAQVARDAGIPGVINVAGHYYDEYLLFNPTYFPTRAVVSPAAKLLNPALTLGAPLTQSQYDAIIAAIIANPKYGFPTPPSNPVAWYCNCQRNNGGPTRMDGVDFVGNYVMDTAWGTARFGANASMNLDLMVALTPTSPMVDEDNRLTYPLRFSGRLHAGLDHDAWSGTVYFNFKNGYLADPSLVATGLPARYLHIDSWKTMDVSGSYNFGPDAGIYAHDTKISLSITNIFNEGPPLVITGSVNYDQLSASDSGRRIVLTINKKL